MPAPKSLVRAMALALAAAAALIAASRLGPAPQTGPLPGFPDKADPVRQALQRCRTLTARELETVPGCRAAWAEHRRRFLGMPEDRQEDEE